ncbi:type IV pilus assembly protein PilV [Cupriavidus metallidurans]|jgi:type IV pilus assembly protein PilV|uniref:Type-4 fimbrial biogenesis pilV transmembrane protein n=1 Tax=Cupriavidus metallidurans (strain ATCC 43123 / DSM 2839 / NBRC 102507 / CH34) TaxID=266264 RepID=Q1LS01_CUPMC|nr:prepilin-type N-terminal cleavage/methylation domain-containing protein [Cupriavidus metallidurans]ABF07075.1 putative type-4 fimbrial biogenesis pilV transmembrane protein [Cupriavidus metallidurans CH34]AVA32299.1 prepilin-type N-terminal cleavage/methylation domain-containing protein [Cupriavidus metallidurans]MDE4916498.1 prepilin-type N-terminal cleavage/methylation domain-containing protein [Cupriavidus metallidurans]QGS28573.1 prepilin-type N-terminal cleavage/methylation domain-conta
MQLKTTGNRHAAGFSLLEVLIALVITVIGLFGIAKMQAAAIANTQVARGQSLIALQLESLAGAMHGNKGFWAAGLVPATFSMTGATVTDTTGKLSTTAPDCKATTCTPTQLAAYDVQGWAAEMNAHFPTYSAAVNCVVLINKPVTCTVSANWNESNLAYNQTTATLAGQTAQSLTLYVQP